MSQDEASPQTDDGFTRFANELLEAILKYPFTKRELLIVLAVARKTYGYNKKTDWISLSQLSDLTGLHRPHCSATLRDLFEKQVLLKRSRDGHQHIGISKNYRNWKRPDGGLPKRSLLPKRSRGVTETVMLGLPKQSLGVTKTVTQGYQNSNHIRQPYKRQSTKDKPTKDKRQKKGADALVVLDGLNVEAWDKYIEYRQEAKIKKLKPVSVRIQQKWLVEQGDYDVQRRIVDKTKRQGWTGLFELKGGDQTTGPVQRVNPHALDGLK